MGGFGNGKRKGFGNGKKKAGARASQKKVFDNPGAASEHKRLSVKVEAGVKKKAPAKKTQKAKNIEDVPDQLNVPCPGFKAVCRTRELLESHMQHCTECGERNDSIERVARKHKGKVVDLVKAMKLKPAVAGALGKRVCNTLGWDSKDGGVAKQIVMQIARSNQIVAEQRPGEILGQNDKFRSTAVPAVLARGDQRTAARLLGLNENRGTLKAAQGLSKKRDVLHLSRPRPALALHALARSENLLFTPSPALHALARSENLPHVAATN